MNTLKQHLLTNWHFMRWIRLALGVMLAVQAIQVHDMIPAFAGAFFLFQAFTNTGCCGTESCAVPVSKVRDNKEAVTGFTEIKSKSNGS